MVEGRHKVVHSGQYAKFYEVTDKKGAVHNIVARPNTDIDKPNCVGTDILALSHDPDTGKLQVLLEKIFRVPIHTKVI